MLKKYIDILPFFTPILLYLSFWFGSLIALISLVPWLYFLIKSPSNKRSYLIDTLVGTIFGLTVLLPLLSFQGQPLFFVEGILLDYFKLIFASIIILTAIMGGGLFFFIFGWFFRKIKLSFLLKTFIFSLVWVVMEYVRANLFFGLSWGHLGFLLHSSPQMIQLASIWGVYALGFVVLSVNISLTGVLASDKKKNRVQYSVLFLIILILVYGYGALTLQNKSDEELGLTVAVLSSPYNTVGITESGIFNKIEYELRDILSKKQISVVVLPENIFPFFIIDRKTFQPIGLDQQGGIYNLYSLLTDFSKTHPQLSIIFGVHFLDEAQDKYLNSLVVMENGELKDSYQKINLLPITESVPDRFEKEHARLMVSGEKKLMNTQHGLVRGLICSEVAVFSNNSSEETILNIISGNDLVVPTRQVFYYHHIMSKVQAVSNRNYTLRSVKGGVSSIISPYGEVLKHTELGRKKENITTLILEI